MRNLRKLKGFLRMAGPAICGLLASAGVVTTAILSAKGALKAEAVLDDKELPIKDKIKAAAPYFAPAGVSGVATLGLIFAANVLGEKQRAALAAGFLPAYKAYQQRLAFKENAEGEFGGTVTFYEPVSKRYFKRTMEEVLEAEYHLNRNFILRGYAPLNELYDFLGLEKTPDGEKLGWSQEVGGAFYGYEWIDFYHSYVTAEASESGQPYYVLGMPFAPTDDYLGDPYDF